MSYSEDYKDLLSRNEKIPYDDTPISREPTQKKINFSINSKKPNLGKNKSKTFKALVGAVALLFCLNVILIGVLIHHIKTGGNRFINYWDNTVNVSGANISTHAVQKARYSSVCIAAGGNVYDHNSFYNNSENMGSGVIIEKNYDENYVYILTCYHVIDGYQSKINVQFQGYLQPIKAQVVGYSITNDIAVLKVTDLRNIDACGAVTTYNSQNLAIGETAFAVGNSLSGGFSVTGGMISRINKEISVEGSVVRELQIDAAINPGNSGGGLFNAKGEFIGLVNAKLFTTTSGSNTITAEGTAYAFPGTYALSIAKSIIENSGRATYINLGVRFEHDENYPISSVMVDDKLIDNYKVIVGAVSSGSIASGKLKKGDEIISFSYIDYDGVERVVDMRNKYCFEDICFAIKRNTVLKFNIKRAIGQPEGQIEIVASSIAIQK